MHEITPYREADAQKMQYNINRIHKPRSKQSCTLAIATQMCWKGQVASIYKDLSFFAYSVTNSQLQTHFVAALYQLEWQKCSRSAVLGNQNHPESQQLGNNELRNI